MKVTLVLLATFAAVTTAFAPAAFASRGLTSRFADPVEEDEGGLDLDLSEMFDL
jgi:hypothetical protein